MTTEEFNKCVDLYSDNLYRFILKNIRDSEKAKDIVQDTYEKLWLKVSDVSSTNAKSYMFTAAYRTMIDSIRKDKRTDMISESHTSQLQDNRQYTGIKEIINEAVSQLPEIQRSVVLLRDYEGYSYEEIGNITGLSESQVKVYIFRARAFLKNYLVSLEKVI